MGLDITMKPNCPTSEQFFRLCTAEQMTCLGETIVNNRYAIKLSLATHTAPATAQYQDLQNDQRKDW